VFVAAVPCCAADLKPSLSRALNAILEPVRQHFANNKEAAALLKQVRSYKVTR
jgi:tyrosyl-tRNA synthetase